MLSIALLALLGPPAAAAEPDVVLQVGRLYDGVSNRLRGPVSIQIRDERIVAVTDGLVRPGASRVIDLRGYTVLPGLIDCHVHISERLPGRANALGPTGGRGDARNGLDPALSNPAWSHGIADGPADRRRAARREPPQQLTAPRVDTWPISTHHTRLVSSIHTIGNSG